MLVYYFPREDVRMDLLVPTAHRTHCPHKGDASYWTLKAGGRAQENAVWSYEAPLPEDEEIFGHPRDPQGHYCFYPEKVDRVEVEGQRGPSAGKSTVGSHDSGRY